MDFTASERTELSGIGATLLCLMRRNAQRGRIAIIVQRDGTRCHLCGLEVTFTRSCTPDSATLDHVVKKEHGGTRGENYENLKLAHRYCNSARDHRTKEEMMRRITRYWASIPHSQWMAHSAVVIPRDGPWMVTRTRGHEDNEETRLIRVKIEASA